MSTTEIKKLNIRDLDKLVEISRQTFYESFASGNTEENLIKYINSQFTLEKLSEELHNENSEFYFIYADDQIAGYLKINLGLAQTELQDRHSLEIERIYVLQVFQGKKLGQKLLQKAIGIAHERKHSYLWLGVWEKNHKAIAFYEKNGFVEFNQHSFVLGNEVQTDLMMKLML